MSIRLQQRSSLARRILFAIVAGVVITIGSGVALLWLFYAYNGDSFHSDILDMSWGTIWDYAHAHWQLLGLLLLGWSTSTLVIIWGAMRWAMHPLRQLATALDQPDQQLTLELLPLHTRGNVGLVARKFEAAIQSDTITRQTLKQHQHLFDVATQRLQSLFHIGTKLAATSEPDKLFPQLTRDLQKVFDCHYASILLMNGETYRFYTSNHAMPEHVSPQSIVKTAIGQALNTHTLCRVDDVKSENIQASLNKDDVEAELVVPVMYDKQLMAALVLQSQYRATFTAMDEQHLNAFAGFLATTLADRQFIQQQQYYTDRIKILSRTLQTLSANFLAGHTPELLLNELGKVLTADRSAVLLVKDNTIRVMATQGSLQTTTKEHMLWALNDMPLIAEIIEQDRAVWLPNPQQDSRYHSLLGATTTHSWIGAPIHRVEQGCAVLIAESDKTDQYGDDEVHILTTIADHAAIVMENIRQYTMVRDRAEQLEIVTSITQVISTNDISRDLPATLRRIIHLIRRVVPCDYAALALYNDTDDTFFVEPVYDFAIQDWSELPEGWSVAANDTTWQTACRTASPIVQSSLAESAFGEDQVLVDKGLHSSIVVPIIGASHVLGALTFATRKPRAYEQKQVSTLLELAHYLGPALDNARLNKDREEASIKLARTQEHLNLVDKVRVVGLLASGVAHDFNNLLAGVLGNAQLLLLEVEDEEQRTMLRVIEQAAKDGAETVRRLQGFARMENDSPMSEVRLDLLARDAIDITRPRWRDIAQSRGVKIDVVRQLEPVTAIAGRPAELREVLTNLILNAADAMPHGGRITVSAYDEQDAEDQPSAVIIEIADEGVGMSADVRSRIFEPFFTTKGEQGTGLGLAVSLGIVEGHGGQIEIESEMGGGTRFTVRLPVRETAIVDTPRQRTSREIIPGHVLLVQSDNVLREATTRLLERWGNRVQMACDGSEALQAFMPNRYDVVLSDTGMPDMNGQTLLQQIKQQDPRVPTILITGWGQHTTEGETQLGGVDFVIEKPFDLEDLREVLAKAMAST